MGWVIGRVGVVLLLAVLAWSPGCSSRPRIVMLVRASATMEFMIPNEIRPMIERLTAAGYQVDIASETGEKIKAGKEKLAPDCSFAQVDLNRYVGLVVPCCASGPMPKPNTEAAIRIARLAIERKLPIAAQYSGIDLLVIAGLPKETRLARSYLFASAETGPGVVQDGNLVTSGTCPWMARYQNSSQMTEALMTQYIALLPRPH